MKCICIICVVLLVLVLCRPIRDKLILQLLSLNYKTDRDQVGENMPSKQPVHGFTRQTIKILKPYMDVTKSRLAKSRDLTSLIRVPNH